LTVLPGSCVKISTGDTVIFCPKYTLDRKIVSASNAVGLVAPGRDASRGSTPSPVNSTEIGMFPSI